MDLTGMIDSATTAELVGAAVAGTLGAGHRDQITDCKSLLAIEARVRANRPVKHHQRGLLAGIKQARHRVRWHRSHPEKRVGPWGEDDVAVWMADKAAEGTASQWQRGRVMHHLGDVDTAEVLGEVMGRSLTYTKREGQLNICPIKEVATMVEVARRYRITRDAHRADDKKNPRPPKWASTNMRWPAALWNLSKTMSMRRRLFAVKVLYDKHFHGGNLKKINNPDIDTRCQVCEQAADGHQLEHILR